MTRSEYYNLWQKPWYRDYIRRSAKEIASDGCSGVPDFFRDGCLEHDFHYYYHADWLNKPITKAEADERLKWYIQDHSWFGKWSPMAWWRHKAVMRWFTKTANKAWGYK